MWRHQIQAVAGEGQFAVTMADGRTRTESLKRTTPVTLVLPDLREELVFTVFPLARYDAILGKPWLSMNNPTIAINYSTNEVQVGCGKSWSARTDSRPAVPQLPSAHSHGGEELYHCGERNFSSGVCFEVVEALSIQAF